MGSLGVGPVSHLFLKLRVPGGSKHSRSSSPTPNANKRRKVPQVIVSSDDEEGTKPPKLKKPKPPVKSRDGRISHSHRKQHRDDELPDPAQASSPPSTLHPMPETPVKKTKDRKTTKSSIAKFTPKTARSVAFALSGYELPSSDDWSGSETDDWDNKSKNRQPKRKARPLNRVDHKTKGWQRLGSSHRTEVYKTFEQWCNTYNSHDYETADDLVKHLGHPVDRPKDIRARPFILQWITPDRDVPKALSDDPRPVFRAVYSAPAGDPDPWL
ncbi:hypothetical protein B0H13DRAFT_2301435 [Mycena leptocephala]|nr:hypothetical protein B0H13DRAFT_2301435 [Mycena leptocephala]